MVCLTDIDSTLYSMHSIRIISDDGIFTLETNNHSGRKMQGRMYARN